MFSKNMGGIDRGLRVIVGLALIGSAVTGVLGPWAYIGVVPVFTAFLGSCPLYNLVGIKTCKLEPQEGQAPEA